MSIFPALVVLFRKNGDWEKHSRLGLQADDLQQVIARWPSVNDKDEDGNDFLAINNCMNEVCHGFSTGSAEWSNWFDTPRSEIEATYRKWLALKRHLWRNTLTGR